jgi:L-threonylcarbamoyladenylate synthase
VFKEGGIIAYRTDTFYGLGVDPFNPTALQSLILLKGRAAEKPILVVLSDTAESARFITHQSEVFKKLSNCFWPGALTLVVEALSSVPFELTAGTGSVGVRVPGDEQVREFVRACGGALTATSANLSGELPARSVHEVERAFPERLTLIVDGGETQSEKPSTVLKIDQDNARLLREGVVSRGQLEEILEAIGVKLQ